MTFEAFISPKEGIIQYKDYEYGKRICTSPDGRDLLMGHAVCFDFDGVIHKYSRGWLNGDIYDSANIEMVYLMHWFVYHGVPVFICSVREPKQIIQWWNDLRTDSLPYPRLAAVNIFEDEDITFWNSLMYIGVTNKKLPAQLYIDDRGYKYTGQSALDIISGLGFTKEGR